MRKKFKIFNIINIIQFYKNIYVHFILDAYTTEIVYELSYEVTMDTYFQVTSYILQFFLILFYSILVYLSLDLRQHSFSYVCFAIQLL
jgi:hypothetical protein